MAAEINCMVVDDDPIFRQYISKQIVETNGLKLIVEADSATKAIELLEENDIDIIFLDVQMPEMTGIELVQRLNNGYEVILVTANDSYAVDAFDQRVTDYLIKPFEYDRFSQAINKARVNIETFRNKKDKVEHIFIKSDGKIIHLKLADILFIEALADYVVINTEAKKYIVHHTMKGVEKKLPEGRFVRVHRSFIVNLEKIDFIEDLSIHIKVKSIPIGASYKEKLYKTMNFL
ncbi:MAG: DNA-binding LytR/AlgR family response regulator [Marivirga sp.]|jgi:DNA-binding LytR/AlgR family response regulator